MYCQNSSWKIGSRIYGEEKSQVPLSSPTTIDSLVQDSGWIDRVCTDKKSFDGYIFFLWYKLIHFPLPLNPAIHRMDNAPIFYVLDVKNKEDLTLILYFIASSPKLLIKIIYQ